MREELLINSSKPRGSPEYIPLIVDQRSFFETGKRLGSQSELFNEKVLQDNNLFRLTFRAGNNNYQFTNLSPSDYTAVLSWLEGTLEDNTSSLSPLMGAAAGFTVGIATSSFRTRRDFLKGTARTLGLTAFGMAMSSCSPKERISLQTEALLQTATAIQAGEITPSPEPQYYRTPLADATLVKTQEGYTILTSTPEKTPSPTLTVTEVLPEYNFEPGNWAEKEDGTLNPQVMYPLVGTIDKKHHNVVDLAYGDLQIAMVSDRDLTLMNSGEYDQFKNNQATQINNNLDLKSQLDQVKSLINQNKIDKYTVVIENGAVEWIVYQTGDIITYSKLENGQLVKEQEPRLLPKLEIRGKDIIRTDTGEPVVLRGFEIASPIREPSAPITDEEVASKILKVVKLWGGNFVRLQTVTSYIESHRPWIEKFMREAERLGIYVMFSAASKNGGYNDITLPDDEVIQHEKLLAEILKPFNNGMIQIWNEPGGDDNEMNIPKRISNIMQSAIDKIRSVNSEIIIAPLTIYVPTIWKNYPLVGDNLLYAVTDHRPWNPWEENDPNDPNKWNTKEINDPNIDTIPVNKYWDGFEEAYFIWEFSGGMGLYGTKRDEENIYAEKKAKFYQQNGISFTNWSMSGWGMFTDGTDSGDMFSFNGEIVNGAGPYALSDFGITNFNILRDYPPYQFDK